MVWLKSSRPCLLSRTISCIERSCCASNYTLKQTNSRIMKKYRRGKTLLRWCFNALSVEKFLCSSRRARHAKIVLFAAFASWICVREKQPAASLTKKKRWKQARWFHGRQLERSRASNVRQTTSPTISLNRPKSSSKTSWKRTRAQSNLDVTRNKRQQTKSAGTTLPLCCATSMRSVPRRALAMTAASRLTQTMTSLRIWSTLASISRWDAIRATLTLQGTCSQVPSIIATPKVNASSRPLSWARLKMQSWIHSTRNRNWKELRSFNKKLTNWLYNWQSHRRINCNSSLIISRPRGPKRNGILTDLAPKNSARSVAPRSTGHMSKYHQVMRFTARSIAPSWTSLRLRQFSE